MKTIIREKLAKAKRRIERRLKGSSSGGSRPMMTGKNIRYEIADKTQGIGLGGIGAIHCLAQQIGLVEAIDRHVQVLKIHLPYHESDHVLNLAYNALCDGTRLEDIELRRNDVSFSTPWVQSESPIRRRAAISAAAFWNRRFAT